MPGFFRWRAQQKRGDGTTRLATHPIGLLRSCRN